jgi:LmeA-like phospholipid-binding
MKHFLLGVGATLATLALALVALLLVLGSGSGEAVAVPTPTASGTASGATPQPPPDLADDETWLGSVELRSGDVVSADAELSDVVATGSGVRFSESGLRADRLDLDATVPFETVAAQVGEDVRLYDAGDGLAGIERTITFLGRDLAVSAEGTVVADGGQLLIEPETVDLGGPAFLDSAVSSLARSLVTIRQDVPGVPEGMALTDVEVTDAGFAASLSGTDVTIGR